MSPHDHISAHTISFTLHRHHVEEVFRQKLKLLPSVDRNFQGVAVFRDLLAQNQIVIITFDFAIIKGLLLWDLYEMQPRGFNLTSNSNSLSITYYAVVISLFAQIVQP